MPKAAEGCSWGDGVRSFPLLFEGLVDQLGASPRQVNPQALDAVIESGRQSITALRRRHRLPRLFDPPPLRRNRRKRP